MKLAAHNHDRRPLIAKLHMAKKDLGLSESEYRAMLEHATGKRSAAEMHFSELDRALVALKAAGWKEKKKAAPGGKAHVGMIHKLWGDLDAAGVLDDPSDRGLRAFVVRQTGVASPEFLDPKAATKVIEGLKRWLARAQPKAMPGA